MSRIRLSEVFISFIYPHILQNIIKSREILNEKFSIVQLSYRSQILLVASEYRCIIYKQSPDNSKQQIYQVGQKERVR